MLDLLLSSQNNVIGLGEVLQTADRFKKGTIDFSKELCSCGQIADKCHVWSQALELLKENENEESPQAYRNIIQAALDCKDKPEFLIDSSKYLDGLGQLLELNNLSVKVIHLSKDVRNFIISHIDNRKRKGRKQSALQRFYMPFGDFRRWHSLNSQVLSFLKKNKIDYITVSYEDLCFSTEDTLSRIGSFVGMQGLEAEICKSGSHALCGNRLRLAPAPIKIKYDYRWFYRKEWMLPSLLLPEKFSPHCSMNQTESV